MTPPATPYLSPPRLRKKRRRPRSEMSLNLTAMIDTTFLMLTFFVTTSSMKEAEGYLASRPPVDGPGGAPLPITPIVVRLEPSDGAGCRIRIDNFAAAPTSFTELSDVLAQIKGNPGFGGDTPVVLMAGQDVAWDHVVNAWNAAVRAGYREIRFGSQS